MTARTTQELYDRFCDGGSAQKNLSEREQDFEDLIDSLGSVGITVAASDASNSSKGKADYVCDGTADDVEIQAAIDALPAGGGKVLLSEGTFNITSQILMDDDTWLQGSGTGTILFLVAGTNTGLIRNRKFQTANDPNLRLVVRDLMIDGNKDNNDTDANDGGVSFSAVVDAWVQNVWVKNFRGFGGIYVSPYGTHDPVRCHIIDCHVEGSEGTGSYGCGIYVTGATYHGSISGCTLDGNGGHGIMIEDNCANLAVSNCLIKDSGNRGILVNKSTDVTISNVVIENSTYDGIQFSDACSSVAITNCVIYDCGQAGIHINADEDNISDIVLANNICYDNAGSGWSGIYIQRQESYTVQNVVIQGNRLYGTPQGYGIVVGTGTSNSVITGNDLIGNQTGAINQNGSGMIIRDNLGYLTENFGTATIVSGQTTLAVAHGLSTTPTVINIAFREQGTNDFGRWWVSTIGAANFTLNVSADPGASNLDFAWEAKVR